MVQISRNRRNFAVPSALLVLLLFACPVRSQSSAECNVCLVASNQACISATEYQICNNGIPSGTIVPCSTGQKCSLGGTCKPDAEVPVPACQTCEVCDASNVFACTSSTSFALCLGTDNLTAITAQCLPGFVCDINSPQICGSVTEGFRPSCAHSQDPTTLAPATTPSPSTQPEAYCQTIQEEGRFPVGNIKETTCRQYIRCIDNDGTWVSAVYYCPGDTYFNEAKRVCTTTVPARCNGSSTHMTLFNLVLP